ncbi:MAG: hypothetical protein WA045_02755, partial [Nitrospira sp.]
MKAAHVVVALSLVCLGCTTPPEVKQALIAKDQGYAENQRLMQQYRELVSQVTQRHQQWYRYLQTRLKLNLALQWATTNPTVTGVGEADLAKDDADLLGPDVMTLINEIRLKNLPERKGPNGQLVFSTGAGDMNTLLQKLPHLVGRVERRVGKDSQLPSNVDLMAFDHY